MPSRRYAPYQRKNLKRPKGSQAKAASKSLPDEPWTFEEDEELRAAVFKHGGKKWKLIATFLANRSPSQCNERWNDLQNYGSAVKRPWTDDEDAHMVKLVQTHGPSKWSVIASYLPGRNGKQCRERWHNQLNPAIRKGPWTPEEDEIIMQLQAKYGNKWAKITEKLPGRTDNAVKNHWHSSMKARAKEARAAAAAQAAAAAAAKTTTKTSRKRRGGTGGTGGSSATKKRGGKRTSSKASAKVKAIACMTPDDVADLDDLMQQVENPDDGLFSLEAPIVDVDAFTEEMLFEAILSPPPKKPARKTKAKPDALLPSTPTNHELVESSHEPVLPSPAQLAGHDPYLSDHFSFDKEHQAVNQFCEAFDVESMADVFLMGEPSTEDGDDLHPMLTATQPSEEEALFSCCALLIRPSASTTPEIEGLRIGWSDFRDASAPRFAPMGCRESGWPWEDQSERMEPVVAVNEPESLHSEVNSKVESVLEEVAVEDLMNSYANEFRWASETNETVVESPQTMIKLQPLLAVSPCSLYPTNSSSNVWNVVETPVNPDEPTLLLPHETSDQLVGDDAVQWTMVNTESNVNQAMVEESSNTATSWLGVEAMDMSELLLVA